MTQLTASVEFQELAQGYRDAPPDGAQAAYERLCAFVEQRESTFTTIIAAKDGEIGALTAEVTHLAEKLAERDAKAGSVGDDAEFRILTRNWREHAATSAGGLAWSKLVGYLDSRSASAPSVDRNSVLEEAARLCDMQQDEGECPERASYCAESIRALKSVAPQPVDAAQVVPKQKKCDRINATWPQRIYLQSENEHGNGAEPFNPRHEITWCQDQIGSFDIEYVRADLTAAQIAQPTDTTKGA